MSKFTIIRLVCAAVLVAFAASVSADTWNNETDSPQELDFVNLQFPHSFTLNPGETTPLIFGRVFESGVTEASGDSGLILAQVGYGAHQSDPRLGGWNWFNATFNVQVGNDDEYMASFTAPGGGTYSYTYRFSIDSGATWTAADTNGAGSNPGLIFETGQLGTMTVVPEPASLGLLTLGAVMLLRRRAIG